MSEVLYPELVDDDQDTNDTDMKHIRSLVPGRGICGTSYDPNKPVSWGPVPCVVCMGLWSGMSSAERGAITRYWSFQG